jgi:predicted Zn-dependent protease
MSLARGSLLALALAACAWFVVGIRQAHDTAHANAIVSAETPPGPAAAARARSLLHAAGFLNPDQRVDLLRGQLALDQGDRPRALALFRDVARREPDNLQAWVSVAQASTEPNSPLLKRAVHEIGRLDPQLR